MKSERRESDSRNVTEMKRKIRKLLREVVREWKHVAQRWRNDTFEGRRELQLSLKAALFSIESLHTSAPW